MMLRAVGLLAAALALGGCATPRGAAPLAGEPAATAEATAGVLDATTVFATQSAREARLAALDTWQLEGRAAFASGREGASARIRWIQRGEHFDIALAAPVTGRTWRLHGGLDAATLDGLDGGSRTGPDAEALLFEATGWRLPVRHLPAWVRGARGDGPAQALAVDATGLPLAFEQAGWRLTYRDWWPGDPALPRRVFASADGASVRLLIGAWSVPE